MRCIDVRENEFKTQPSTYVTIARLRDKFEADETAIYEKGMF